MIARPVSVIFFLMAISVFAHMLYFGFTRSDLQKSVYGPFNTPAQTLVESRGKAIWSPTDVMGEKIARREPAYTFFLASTYLILGINWGAIAVTLSVVCGLVSIMVFFIGSRIFSYRVGFLASVWVILYPYYFFQGSPPNIYETMLFTFFLLLSVWGLLRMQGNLTVKDSIISGIFLGLAALCRPTVLSVVPLALVWFFFTSSASLRKQVWSAASLFLAFVMTLMPWTLRNSVVEGVFSPFGLYGKKNIYKAFHPVMMEYYLGEGLFTDPKLRSLSSDRVYEQAPLWDAVQTMGMTTYEVDTWRRSMPWLYWRQHPIQFVKLTALKVIALWSWKLEPLTLSWVKQTVYAVSYVPVLILGVMGFWLQRDKWRQTSLFVTLFLSFTLFSAVAYGVTRYRAPVDAYLIIMASVSVVYLIQRLFHFKSPDSTI
ncbi:ArnT family glycosyltransferase [Chloroflexota bacterium]